MRSVIYWILGLVGMLLAGAAMVVYAGLYDVGATRQHLQVVYTLLETTMRQSVRQRAQDVKVPALDDAGFVQRGGWCFRARCVQCHGGPGLAPMDIGKSMQPLPGPLVDAARRWQPRELYWITRHGIRMSGMPAWEKHLSDQEIWSLVAFMQVLPEMDAPTFDAATNSVSASSRHANVAREAGAGVPICGEGPERDAPPQLVADAQRGRQALYQYACSACHSVPGVAHSSPYIGPPLAGMGARTLIAGRLPNTHDNMVQWLRRPHAIKPGTVMPELGVSEADAHDIAKYLSTLR